MQGRGRIGIFVGYMWLLKMDKEKSDEKEMGSIPDREPQPIILEYQEVLQPAPSSTPKI
jgi:hypothetical protein